jgi:iron(III) transport system substrate-binding protein
MSIQALQEEKMTTKARNVMILGIALLVSFGLLLTACQPETIVETVEVEVETVIKETVMVEVEVEAEQAISGQIVLYTSESEDKVNEMVADFNEVYPDIEIFIFRTGTGEVTAKLQAEMEGGDIKADLMWFADLDFFRKLSEEDMLLEYMPIGGDLVDAQNHYFDNKAHEVRYIFNIVAYNTGLVDTPPTGWKDLLNPDYKGRIGMASALYSGGAFNNLGTLVNEADFGWEFYEALNENEVVVGRGNGGIGTNIATGEFVMGQLIDFMARNHKNEGSPVEMIWPSEGAVLIPTPVAIYKNTTNPAACQAFLDYLYSDRAQALFVSQNYVSIDPDAPKPDGFADFPEGGVKILVPPVEFMAENREELRNNYEDLFGPPPEA